MEVCQTNKGLGVQLEVTPYYVIMTVGADSWYWNKDSGRYDGISRDLTKRNPGLSPIRGRRPRNNVAQLVQYDP